MTKSRLPVAPGQPVVERTMGCWSCIHASPEDAKSFWEVKRFQDLSKVRDHAADSAMGENDPQVIRVRRMVDQVDRAVAAGLLHCCRVNGSDADLVSMGFLCDKWTGKEGASVARAGAPVDKLPGELMEDLMAGKLPRRKIT